MNFFPNLKSPETLKKSREGVSIKRSFFIFYFYIPFLDLYKFYLRVLQQNQFSIRQ